MNSESQSVEKKALESRTKIGNYFVRKKIAEGFFSVVYEAGSEFSNKTFAIKELFVDDLCKRSDNGKNIEIDECKKIEFEDCKSDFVKEAEELQRLNHKNIVVEHDLIRDLYGTSYLVMENLEGGTLEDRIKQASAGIRYSELKKVMLGVLDALDELHGKNILHRDVKPQNIGFRKSEEWGPVLMDFGISCRTMQPKCISGTPPYSPLDQDSDTDEDHKEPNDIYAFGATLYHCMTGALPPTAKQRHIDRSKGKPDAVKKSLFSNRTKSLGYPRHVLRSVNQMMQLSGDKRGEAKGLKKKIEKRFHFGKFHTISLILISLLSFLYFHFSRDLVTEENYSRISLGMNEKEIYGVLGRPKECKKKFARRVCVWGDERKFIEVTFVRDSALLLDSEGLR